MMYKILKIQLIVLFVLSVIVSLFYYVSSENIYDNYFIITSSTKSFSNIFYYITTLAAFVEYFTGSWIIVCFLLYALVYSTILCKRERITDLFLVVTIMIMVLSFSAYAFPNYIGKGLGFYISNDFSLLSSPLIVMILFFINISIMYDRRFFSLVLKSTKIAIKIIKKEKDQEIPQQKISRKESIGNDLESIAGNFKKNIINCVTENLRGTPIDVEKDRRVEEIHKEESDEMNSEELNKNKQEVKKLTEDNDKKYYQIVNTINAPKDKAKNCSPDDKYFEEIISRIEEKLNEFKIEGQVINILKGPVVDTFELELGAGVKVSKITSSSEDLSMALYGAPIRIVYPMRGKTTVGIEVPRNPREIIYLDELLTSKDFQKNKYDLPLAMGKDAFGEPFIVDLAAMPHMLVAGSTGSGKSVFINSLLVSLLIKKSPDQMKLILIDPKQLELSLYSDLPHLLLPVVTEAKTASLALAWAVKEMDRRYSIMKEFQVRNLKGFNEKLRHATSEMLAKISKFYVPENGQTIYDLANIVIIVDEFADLILTRAGKEIESNICRLAGKARAAGIHMVVATQRPSVDVITGLIKSNFPTRVSFRVTTSIDSRTILNAIGAEKLLGKGDMLYKSGVETIRVHSSFVDEDEIEALTSKLSQIRPEFCQDALEYIENGGESGSVDPYAYGSHISSTKDQIASDDTLFEQAVTVVMEYQAASASMLQRRLKIGYNRAANLIDQMEEKGIIGPAQGSKPRRVIGGAEPSP